MSDPDTHDLIDREEIAPAYKDRALKAEAECKVWQDDARNAELELLDAVATRLKAEEALRLILKQCESEMASEYTIIFSCRRIARAALQDKP